MNNLVPKKNIVRLAVSVALLSMVLYFGGLLFVLREINNKKNIYNSTESASYKEEKARVIQSIVETNKESITTLQDFFVLKGDEVKFIEQIENVAHLSGIKFEISSIDIKTDQAESFKEDVYIKIMLTGSWKNIMSFIDKLEKMSFGVLVEKINLDANYSGNWSGFIDFIIFNIC